MTRTALISGASIAGPATAYWLRRYGFDVTVVERSPKVRTVGYPIDVRGTAMDAARQMGLGDELLAAHIATRRLRFVDADGRTVASIRPETITGGVEGRDVEIPRGSLTALLWAHTSDSVEYVFNNSIDSLVDHSNGVDVTFANGGQRTYDVVIGADGLHSNVRRLVFGPESQYERYLGRYFVGFRAENTLGLSREGMLLSVPPGRNCVQYAVGDTPSTVQAFLSFDCPEPPALDRRDLQSQRRLFEQSFNDLGWVVPSMLQSLREDDDAFFDTVSQIHMPTWSEGRVSLVGDAGYAPSFLSGQGSSLALVGGYLLGNELGTTGDHCAAMANYERLMRPFVTANQSLAVAGRNKLSVQSERQVRIRNIALRVVLPLMDRLRLGRFAASKNRKATTAISMPSYSHAPVPGYGLALHQQRDGNAHTERDHDTMKERGRQPASDTQPRSRRATR